MSLNEEIKSFQLWAASLGCPLEAIPNEDALKGILKSRQRELFTNLQKRIRTRQHVKEARENILIKQVENSRSKLIAASYRKFLPMQLQRQLEVSELRKCENNAKMSLEEAEHDFDKLAAAIKQRNIQVIALEDKKQLLESKCNILNFKRESLAESYKIEEQLKQRVSMSLPLKLTVKNANEATAKAAVEEALRKLDHFYTQCKENNNNTNMLQDIKQNLWQQMRTIFANVPNFLLFNVIMKLKGELLQHIIELSKIETVGDGLNKSIPSNINTKESLSSFEIKLYKTKADLLGIVAKYIDARAESEKEEERFSTAYEVFVEQLQNKVNLFNVITDEEKTKDIISNFVMQYNLHNFNVPRNEYLNQQIEQYRFEIDASTKELESHELLLGTVKQTYNEINTSFNRMHSEGLQLAQIKEKIVYSRNLVKSMFEDIQTTQPVNIKANLLSSKLKGVSLSASLMSIENFDLGNENVLCSTKLDFDGGDFSVLNTTMRRSYSSADMTVLPTGNSNNLNALTFPSHTAELTAFAEIPLERLRNISNAFDFHFAANPLIIEGRELATTVQLAPGLLLTPYGAIEEVQRRILWASAIAEHAEDLKFNLDMIIVNADVLSQKSKEQRESISQLLDSIDAIAESSVHTLRKIKRTFNFILKNPLGSFIPPTKLFNDLPFRDYEQNFILYHRMATFGGSIK